jgi:hypothetical protein
MAPKRKAAQKSARKPPRPPPLAASSKKKTKTTATPPASRPTVAIAEAVADVGCSAARLLFRRATEDRVERSILNKLGMFPRQQLQNNTNDEGKHLDEVVRDEHLRLRPSRRYIKLEFWEKIIKDFKFTGTMVESLPQPADVESVSKDLDICLKAAHHENPALKSPEKLVRLLDWAPAMNRTEYFGLLTGSFESPSMSAKHSDLILEGVIKFIARTKAHETFPDYWEIIRDSFDRLLARVCSKALADGVPRLNFLRAHRTTLALFIDIEKAQAIDSSVRDMEDPLPANVTAMLASQVGSELFAPEALKNDYKCFIDDIDKRIYDLEFHDFESDELTSFRRIMMASAEHMDDELVKRIDKKVNKIKFLGSTVAVTISNINDMWAWTLEARYKTIAISNLQVPRLPWETLLWGDGPIPGVPTTVKIPEELLDAIKNSREVALKVLGNSWQSVATMQTTVAKHGESWMKLDKSFWMEKAFLMECLDVRLAEHMKAELMTLIPDFGVKIDINKCVVACKKLSHGDVVLAAGSGLCRELQGVVNLLQDCIDCHSPSAIEVSRMSSFSILFVKKCENFCRCDAYVADSAGIKSKRVELQGKAAITARFDRCLQAELGMKDPLDIKEFRMFKWMLSSEQQEKIDVWHKEVMLQAKARLEDQRQAAIVDITSSQVSEQAKQKDMIHGAEVAIISTSHAASSKSSSASSVTKIVPAPLKKQKTAEKAILDKCSQDALEGAPDVAVSNNLMIFFGAKAK